ncbi:MAG: DNA-3-methyladenine glycosylase 2 family protein [Polyangiaceae bacterium]
MRSVYRPARPLDLARVLGPLSRGPFDPCLRREKVGTYWRASRTPLGPSTTRFTETPDGIEIESFGEGAEWAVAHAPDLLGDSDDPTGFEPKGKLAEIHRRNPGLRIGRSNAVYEAALRSVCEQLVTGREAQRSFDRLARKFGEKAPGPFELRLPPAPEVVARLAYYDLRPMGLEMKRANTLRAVGRSAKAIEETLVMSLPDAYQRLLFIDGIGPWTAAEVAVVAWGDADAVSVGDYHLKNLVSFAFTGEARGTDERMLELLEPYRPHRARVIKLIYAAGIRAPRFGPRNRIRDF